MPTIETLKKENASTGAVSASRNKKGKTPATATPSGGGVGTTTKHAQPSMRWVNHFPGMAQAVSKSALARELNRIRELLVFQKKREKQRKKSSSDANSFDDEEDEDGDASRAFDFYPQTFLLPRDEKAAVEYLVGGSGDDAVDGAKP